MKTTIGTYKRKSNGQFKAKHKGFVKFLVLIIVFLTTLFIGLQIVTSKVEMETIEIEQAQDVSMERFEKHIEKLKNDVVAQLKKDESGGINIGDGDIFYTHDPQRAKRPICKKIGGLRDIMCDSWGNFQYKITTVQYYYQKLYDKSITQKEALLIALDDKKAEELTKDIVFKHVGGVWEWTSAQNKKDWYNMRITFIRELEASI